MSGRMLAKVITRGVVIPLLSVSYSSNKGESICHSFYLFKLQGAGETGRFVQKKSRELLEANQILAGMGGF